MTTARVRAEPRPHGAPRRVALRPVARGAPEPPTEILRRRTLNQVALVRAHYERGLDLVEELQGLLRMSAELGIDTTPAALSSAQEWCSTQEAAAALGVSRTTVRTLAEQGKIPARRVSRNWRIARAWVESGDARSALSNGEHAEEKE